MARCFVCRRRIGWTETYRDYQGNIFGTCDERENEVPVCSECERRLRILDDKGIELIKACAKHDLEEELGEEIIDLVFKKQRKRT